MARSPEAKILQRILRGYQSGWLRDLMTHPYVMMLGARQIGKSMFVALFIAIILCADRRRFEPPREWTCLSSTRPHAVKLAREIKKFMELILKVRAANGYVVPTFDVANTEEIILSNGNSVQVRAATMRSVVGCRDNVLIDEIGVVPDQEQVFETAYPIVQQARANGRDAHMIVISNATHRGTWWHQEFTGSRKKDFLRLTAKWDDCMRRMGRSSEWIKRESERIVDSIGAPAFQQWYQCQWRSLGGSYFSPELLNASGHAGIDVISPHAGVASVGYDVGRHMDPSSIHALYQRAVGRKEVRLASRGQLLYDMEYQAQRDHLRAFCESLIHPVARVVVDRTGSGDHQAEELVKELGGIVEPFTFSEQSKWMLFSQMRDDLAAGILKLDRGDFDTRMHLEAITTKTNRSGKVAIETPRQGRHHCDLAISLGLANYGLAA